MKLNRENLKVTRWLKDELKGCESVLDLGCGQSSLLQYVPGIKRSMGVEYWKPYIDESRAAGIHTDYINDDILSVDFQPNSYDAVMLVDVLEHIEKQKAVRLLLDMQRWAKKKVVVIVPNGFMPQDDPYGDGNEKQEHVSGWTPSELRACCYDVRGFGGWRPLRGDGAEIVPTRTRAGHYLLSGLSVLSQPFVENRPDHAFHLFAVARKA